MSAATVAGPPPRLFGASYSVYVRIARLVLAEKGVACEQVPVDVFAPDGPPPDYRQRHPFGRIPAFEHDGFRLYETGAITRYVDEAFAGPALQPAAPRARARMNQLIGIADAYAYPALVWGVYVERVEKPERDMPANEAAIAAALPPARICLAAMAELMGEGPWLAGATLSLADLHLAPMIGYFLKAPEGAAMFAGFPALADWWARLAGRPSLALLAAEE
ncbi:glutathione S-transferase family protein [Ancylobacter sp. Lp-2]|uniref:glutathione S-transferase family protein n=1 Tax=Ancylobacter sp. Lp-2 TaxID=2881339 RepID=UPI001E363ACE|nr:glutathione S-transferase family protein [Ancylobacter sp. Lp-2]